MDQRKVPNQTESVITIGSSFIELNFKLSDFAMLHLYEIQLIHYADFNQIGEPDPGAIQS